MNYLDSTRLLAVIPRPGEVPRPKADSLTSSGITLRVLAWILHFVQNDKPRDIAATVLFKMLYQLPLTTDEP
jgi:hypothetical protein